MDINDVINIKFIVAYYCLRVCSIQDNDETIVHAQTACRKLKPHLLLSNCCYIEYFSFTLSLSLNSWLTKLQRRP